MRYLLQSRPSRSILANNMCKALAASISGSSGVSTEQSERTPMAIELPPHDIGDGCLTELPRFWHMKNFQLQPSLYVPKPRSNSYVTTRHFVIYRCHSRQRLFQMSFSDNFQYPMNANRVFSGSYEGPDGPDIGAQRVEQKRHRQIHYTPC